MQQNDYGQPIGDPLVNWQPPDVPQARPIAGQYVRLEPLDPNHAGDLFAANTSAGSIGMWTYMGYGPFATLDAYRVWLESVCHKRDPLFYALIDNHSARAVGVASYLRIEPAAGTLEVGHIAYSPLLQGKTAATEAMYLLMKNAFDLGYRRYEWKCDALNAPSRHAALRLGFTFEGIFRQATHYKGRNRDTAWFSVIDKDWPRLDAAFRTWLDPENFNANGEQRTRLSELTK